MKALSRADKIGVVVHGPEVIDSGSAQKVLSYLEKFGDITAVLGGTMGRLAIIDADLGDTIKISPRRRPSQSIKELQPNSDIIVILNQAKTRETGLTFGIKVAANAGATRPISISPAADGSSRFLWVQRDEETALVMAKDLGVCGPSLPEERLSTNTAGWRYFVPAHRSPARELISINGTVVAKAQM
jgi:hypothetical protein